MVMSRPHSSVPTPVMAGDVMSFFSANDADITENYRQSTDNDLVAAMGQNSSHACAELYRRHMASVVAASRVILRFGPDSEDVATEVFVRLWMTPESFDPSLCSVVGFLRMSAKRRSIDYLRSASARSRREASDFQGVTVSPQDSDAHLIASEQDDLLRRSVASLPEFEREAIETAYYGDMTYNAAATHLGLAEGTVKSRIRNGLKRLKMIEELRLVHDQLSTESSGRSAPMKTTTDVEWV
jgi:RNA polymerase sigma-70 factor (ECF subfamily)